MIRSFSPKDLDTIMRIWLEGNLDAHPFISPDYWISRSPLLRQQLPLAKILVWESEETVLAFAGMQGEYLAGIFVDRSFRSRGIGGELFRQLKSCYPSFHLNVYEKNEAAVRFYLKEGLQTTARNQDADTGEMELTMKWSSEQRRD